MMNRDGVDSSADEDSTSSEPKHPFQGSARNAIAIVEHTNAPVGKRKTDGNEQSSRPALHVATIPSWRDAGTNHPATTPDDFAIHGNSNWHGAAIAILGTLRQKRWFMDVYPS